MYRIGKILKLQFAQISLFSLLALIIHAIVLKFIYPGYYSPLYPYHSDFYIPVEMAHNPGSTFLNSYTGAARPVGMYIAKLTGYLGVHGEIVFTIVNVAVNCALSANLFRRILRAEFTWQFIAVFCIYCYLLFSHPYFYNFYSQDVLSHLAYFFLVAGASLFYRYYKSNRGVAYSCLSLFSLISLLCKETYALTALVCAFIWLVYHYDKKAPLKSFGPFLVMVSTLLLIVLYNSIARSLFVNFKLTSSDPYYVNWSPVSIVKEISLYTKEGVNYLAVGIIVAIGLLTTVFLRSVKRDIYLFAACIAGTFCSWIPNALIPNHHSGGYSFNGAYLLYLPVLFLPVMWNDRLVRRSLVISILLAGLISPVLSKKEYAKQWWTLEQENSQRNLLPALDTLMGNLRSTGSTGNILISGLNITFYPFHHPLSLRYFPHSEFANYDVIQYSLAKTSKRDNSVRFIKPADVQIGQYDAVWMFDGKGSLIGKLTLDSVIVQSIVKNNCQEWILYPDSSRTRELSSILK